MRSIRYLVAVLNMSIRREIAFRANLLVSLLEALTGSVVALLTLEGVFTQTEDLAGWSHAEVIVLLGTFQVASGLLAAFVTPNLLWFGQRVWNGTLDDQLLKPMPDLVIVSLGQHAPLALLQVVVGAGVVVAGVSGLDEPVGLTGVLVWVSLLGAGMVVAWATRFLVALVALWYPSLSLDVVYEGVWQFARYPVAMLERPLRRTFTWLVPVAFIASVPAQALVGDTSPWMLPAAMGMATIAAATAAILWRRGIRHYTGVTS